MDPYNNLRSYGEALIEKIDPARAEAVAVRALAAPSVGLSLRRRLVTVVAAGATFITGNLGVAMAADSAVPGDLLFGLDRAYERLGELVGFSDDHTDERLEEAAQLAEAGNSADALDAVIEQLQSLRSDESTLGPAVVAVEEARDRALVPPSNETAAEATIDAKVIVRLAYGIADAMQNGNRELARELIEDLKDAARANGNGNGRGQNNGKGSPDEPGSRGNGGDRGNSGQAPGQQP